MASNTSIAQPSSCGCGGPDKSPFGGFGRRPDSHWAYAYGAGETSACGNIALSPIECQDCCEGPVDVLPPYVPGPGDLASTPTCKPI